MNPYLNRVMIQDPNQFFGRRSEIRRILARLGADRPQSISLVGERRMGKSSLLYHLTCREVQERHLPDRSSLVIVFLDFQQLRQITVADFFGLLLDEIRRACSETLDTGPPGYRAFQNLLEAFRREKRKLILLFDEFQAITSNPAFSVEFYSYLRSMANNYAVAYLTSSNIELQRLCYSSNISDSPFFNIFSNFYLKTFEREEACDLICRPSSEQELPLRTYADEIIDIAGLFPFYLQIVCSIYFDWLKGNPGLEPDREEIKSRFVEEAAPHFDYFWEHAAPECQALLERLACGEQPNPEEVHICQSLQRKGYLLGEQQRLRLFSPIFADHIRMLASAPARAIRAHSAGGSVGNPAIGPGVRVHQYQILRKAGEGGMGVVYEAEDTELNRVVALKFIKPSLVQDEMPRRRFLQEARSAGSLSHPAIASVFELFEYGKNLGLALEWINGSTLKQRILKEGRVNLFRLLAWMVQALDGLEEAHKHGIVHRDINTSNLMLTLDDRIKIVDFGLARSTGLEMDKTRTAMTVAGALMGTIDYMSPEQAQGIPADARSDLYSLGVVFFEGLTGTLPYGGESAVAKLQAIIHVPVPSLDPYGIERSMCVEPVLTKLLAKSPETRHSSAAELREDLKRLLP
ncbi:MAG TPA: protein kinase [Acidobacteriota bacterium]|nr:protein kinase [Acidobacteriota bacterium]